MLYVSINYLGFCETMDGGQRWLGCFAILGALTFPVTVTVTRENLHRNLPYKTLWTICRNSLSVNTSQQITRFQKGYSSCAEGKIQRKFSRITVTVTGKVTAVSSQSSDYQSLSANLLGTIYSSVIGRT